LSSDAKIAAVNMSETVHDYQLMVATNGDGYKMKQYSGVSQPRPDLKLTVINVETKDDVELVECQLETAKHSSVSFKFSRLTDQPSDVAASLVSQNTLEIIGNFQSKPRMMLSVFSQFAH